MIKPLIPQDSKAVIALAKKLGMFDEEGLEHIQATLSDYYDGNSNDLWFTANSQKDDLMGVIYCAPEPMTNGTWNILMLLVNPDHHGKGHGSALMTHIEQTLAKQGERLLIVETSSLDEFERAQAFYRKCGYNEEARIRDFYDAGDDKIIFSKALATS